MFIYVIIGIIIVLLIYFVAVNNSLVQIKNRVEEAFSTMDVYLKKRWDLIPNLVETVKGYAEHESETLEEIIKLRNASYDSMSSDDKVELNNKLSQKITQLLAIGEAYPELKANENFNNLSKEIVKIEEDIANSRKYYNASVRVMNNKVEMFPSNIVASMRGFKKMKMFEASEEERKNIKVQF